MRKIPKIIFGVLTIFLSCKTDKDKTTDNFPIPDPKLVDFDTSDIVIKRATIKVRDYLTLKEGDTSINDFYLDSVYVKMDTIILLINHADYYVEWRMMKEEESRMMQLEGRGDTLVEALWVPPTGNWSGRDRTILYLHKMDSIIDILYQ